MLRVHAATRPPTMTGEAVAIFPGVRARRAVEWVDVRAEPERVADGGFWGVVGDFEGRVRAWRFADVERVDVEQGAAADSGRVPETHGADGSPRWRGPDPARWRSSMDEQTYRDAVAEVRSRIRAGQVYQVNVCRLLSAPLPMVEGREPDAAALGAVLGAGNPAPFGAVLHVPHPRDLPHPDALGGDAAPLPGVWVVSASPELYLRVATGTITSAPIKGTAVDVAGLAEKDRAENVMITDLVRNDLHRVCRAGTVEVTELLEVQTHPGLVHLVSTVTGRLAPEAMGARMWRSLLDATYPPGSVSGAPKSAALEVIRELEPTPRGPYCGVIGWIDADAGAAELAVGIRTFFWTPQHGGRLSFGTGAGITWGSDPAGEWAETELKARRLISLASTTQ